MEASFWEALAQGTGAHVCDAAFWGAAASASVPPVPPAARSELAEDGYTKLHAAATASESQALAAAISTLKLHNWHPLWAVVYDEAWVWLGRQCAALTTGLAVGIEPNWDFMAWYVLPRQQPMVPVAVN